MKYRNGEEVNLRDHVVARAGGGFVAGIVSGIEGELIRVSPAVCGAIAVDPVSTLPIPVEAFEENEKDMVGVTEAQALRKEAAAAASEPEPAKVVELPAAPPEAAPATEQPKA